MNNLTSHLTLTHAAATAKTAPGADSALPAGEAAEASLAFIALLDEQLQQTLVPVDAEQIEIEAEKTETSAETPTDTRIDVAALMLPDLPPAAPATASAVVVPATPLALNAKPLETSVMVGVDAKQTDKTTPQSAATMLPALTSAAEAAKPFTLHEAANELSGAAKVESAPQPALHALANAAPSEQKAVAPTLALAQPVGTERWNTEVGQTVTLLVKAEQTSASLHLNPPDLGPIEVRIDMSGDEANVSFNVQHSDTRNALENALPRLRDILAEAGIALGQTHVQQRQTQDREAALAAQSRGDAPSAETQTEQSVTLRARIGLVDTFA